MRELLFRVDDATLDAFQESVVALLQPHDIIQLLRNEDGTFVYVRSDDDERMATLAGAAGSAGLALLPVARLTAANLPPGDPLLAQIGELLLGGDLRLDAVFASFAASDFPLFPGSEPVPVKALACDEIVRLDDGFGLGDSDTAAFVRDLEDAFAIALQEARADALDEASAALKRLALETMRFRCARPCVLQYDILFGEAKEALDGGVAKVRLPWELQVLCRRQAVETGPVKDMEVIPPEKPAPCEGYQVGGTAVVEDESGKGFDYDYSIVDEVIEEALDQAQAMIAAALKALPGCPLVSCPKERVQIVLGPVDVRADPLSEQGFLFFSFYVKAKAVVPWRVRLTCSP